MERSIDHADIPVSKIAILNSYLQGGHIEIAESESTKRFIDAGKNLGIDIRVFAKSEIIRDFDPDFVVAITYQEGKLTKYPTYVSLNIAPSLIKDVPRFVRNILSCDGFLTISPSVEKWLLDTCTTNNKLPEIAHAAFSVPRTEFKTCDFQNATAVYVGTNWDGLRHKELFWQLSSGEYLKCYGPEKSWAQYPASLYGGAIPFDGVSLFNVYNSSGIGLCIGYPAFDQEGIASSRVFEITASGALAVCSENSLIKSIYGDTVLYLEKDARTEAHQIIEAVRWARGNPQTAQAMAKKAHDIFNKNLAMEVYINNIIDMHKKVIIDKGYIKKSAKKLSKNILSTNAQLTESTVTYLVVVPHIDYKILPIINDILQQSYENINIVMLSQCPSETLKKFLKSFGMQNENIHYFHYESFHNNPELMKYLQENKSDWLGILTLNDRIFSNHTASLLDNYFQQACRIDKISGLFSGSLEHTDTHYLPEVMPMEHYIFTQNKVRISYSSIESNLLMTPLLINFSLLDNDFFDAIDFYELDCKVIFERLKVMGDIVTIQEVTCSTNVEQRIWQEQLQDLANFREQVGQLGQQVTCLKIEINKIVTSRTWKYTEPVRKIIHKIRL